MKTYPLFKVYVPPTAQQRIDEVLKSGYINEGTQVTQLQEKLSALFGTHHLVLVNSCTSAITLALRLAGVRQLDEVITTPMTCVATNTPIVTAGAKIVWADIDDSTGMLSVASVASKITKRTKAVIVVAWAGSPPQLDQLYDLCQKHGVKLILDAAHAFDGRFQGQPFEQYCDYVCYSFQAIKHFTTGDGGALICRSQEDHQRAKALKWFGLDRDRAKDDKGDWKGQQWDVDIVEAGYKFNMNNLTAAIGLSHFDENPLSIVEAHRTNAAAYAEAFSNAGCKVFPMQQAERSHRTDSSFWTYCVRTPLVDGQRDRLLENLNSEGIMAGLVHVPNDEYTAFARYNLGEYLPGTRRFASSQFSLPCGWWLKVEDVLHIAERVKALVRE